MWMFVLLSVISLEAVATESRQDLQKIVDYLNDVQSLFRADIPNMSQEAFKSRLIDEKYFEEERNYGEEVEFNGEIPESFDARKQWPYCKSVGLIRDQANCGSCWAVASASAISDRLCVQSKGRIKLLVSDTDILSCCGSFCGFGCDGGYSLKAWQFMVTNGSCSGGLYGQKGVCKPYAFHPCGEHANQTYYGECLEENEKTPRCRKACQIKYSRNYEQDRVYAISAYAVIQNETAIQKEIMLNGPVQSGIKLYEDFSFYKSGIYKHVWGELEGGHAIKIIGWGVENGTKYWTISNSWNTDWGENGYFRIVRGTNECNVEKWVNAGMMKV